MGGVGTGTTANNVPLKVLFVTDQWGYGPTTMVLAIANELEGRAERWYAGEGAGLELARRSNFERFIATDAMAIPQTPELTAAVSKSDIVVSVMNVHAARLAKECDVPCLYVDSLLWMWQEPPVPSSVVHHFVEWFPGVEERVDEWEGILPATDVVEPITAPLSQTGCEERRQALVNFGGLQSGLIDQETLTRYAVSMTECVVEAMEDWPGSIVVSTRRHVLPELSGVQRPSSAAGLEFSDLSHVEYLDGLECSGLLISSAGMHAMYEAFTRGVPCVFLPAQSLSQALAIVKLRQAGAASTLDWDGLYNLTNWPPATEAMASGMIADRMQEFVRDGQARKALISHLRASVSKLSLDAIVARQSKFFKSFEDRGSERVARYLLHEFGA